MLAATLGAILLRNLLGGKKVFEQNKQLKQDRIFNAASSFK